ncbi:MlaE family ABC transporter permease [Geomesophilobacter sediminis]|uniref:ABC transporter permease n=1 Tax=Geomesophilobacter sediminis TaxID=2798584 RepID=A0A8J7IZG2_9BACT|nr:ABC transporter permease [Geomesophilobacter sediminis]MBJ6723493.1 ABC transporter permease [Geomesophilobacter sediminis]
MTSRVDNLGKRILYFQQVVGEMVILIWKIVAYIREAPRNIPSILTQMAIIGYDTLPVASVMAFFVGMVLALQTGVELNKYGGQNIIGAIVGHSMVRELGPVMTSFLVAGRCGSAMAAELGVMTVYEEIDALKTLDIDPIRYLAMPRFIACLICVPALVIYSDCIGIVGGALISNIHPQIFVSYATYYDSLTAALKMKEIGTGLTKAVVFGALIALVSTYVGFATRGGARGIGESTTRSVVLSFMLILVADYILTRLLM